MPCWFSTTNDYRASRTKGRCIMNEIWKDIPTFEGYYQISNLGHVKSFVKSKKHYGETSHLLNPSISSSGYKEVTLYKSPKCRKKFLVHKLVAEVFLDNPCNYPCVNHKDENKLNNCADNLEWCSYSYNNGYGTARIRSRITKSRPVAQYTLEGIWVATYVTPSIAADMIGCDRHRISDCCNGKTASALGYLWEWCYFIQTYKGTSSPESHES